MCVIGTGQNTEMALDETWWRRRGRALRSAGSLADRTHALSRAAVLDEVLSLAGELMEVEVAARDAAIDAAVEGYLDEHRARGGTVAE